MAAGMTLMRGKSQIPNPALVSRDAEILIRQVLTGLDLQPPIEEAASLEVRSDWLHTDSTTAKIALSCRPLGLQSYGLSWVWLPFFSTV